MTENFDNSEYQEQTPFMRKYDSMEGFPEVKGYDFEKKFNFDKIKNLFCYGPLIFAADVNLVRNSVDSKYRYFNHIIIEILNSLIIILSVFISFIH